MVFAGAVVNPGDIILADPDGVVVVAPEDAEMVLEKSRQREEKEKRIFQELDQGRLTLDLYNFDDKMKALGLTEE